ncbi:MAG: flagellar motor protein MotB [Archangium sp.]|nr:flagellar motor protein MotB [Archangium sp.]
MAKKHKHEEHENHERWVISYADLVTLLFALFVVLYASSRVDTNKLAQASESMRWALHFKGEGGVNKLAIFRGPPTEGGCVTNLGSTPPNSSQQKKLVEDARRKLEKALKPWLMHKEKNPTVSVEIENGKLRLRLSAMRFFDPASAALRPEALAVLDAIGSELEAGSSLIRVEGHTDDGAISSSKYRSNWDLSAARAATVVSYLEQGHQIDPVRLSAAGLGSSHPLVSNDTPENRELNRRIEIVLEIPPQDPRAYQPTQP